MSDMTISAVMRRMQAAEEKAGRSGFRDPRSRRPAVPHGLRSSFRDWAAESTSYPDEMAAMAQAHNVSSDVEHAYRTRSDARRDVFEYIEMFYNRKRIHTNNCMLSTVDFEERQRKLKQAGV
jgi:integrase